MYSAIFPFPSHVSKGPSKKSLKSISLKSMFDSRLENQLAFTSKTRRKFHPAVGQ